MDSDTTTTKIAKKFIQHYLRDRNTANAAPAEQVHLQSFDGKAADVLVHMREETSHLFDLVFLDANKKGYVDYVKFLMGEVSTGRNTGRPLLSPGALIVVDNTLWKGMVLREVPALADALKGQDTGGSRMQKLAAAMHSFNTHCREHPQLNPVLLPIRDGLTVVRYASRTSGL